MNGWPVETRCGTWQLAGERWEEMLISYIVSIETGCGTWQLQGERLVVTVALVYSK